MDIRSEKTIVIGGLLAASGIFILCSQLFSFTSAVWSLFLATAGAIVAVLFLRDRSQHWLFSTSYALWVFAVTLLLADSASNPETWLSKVLPEGAQVEELIAPFVLSALAVPAWVGYFKNKNRVFLNAAYIFSALLLVVLAALFTSGEYILPLILFAAAVPMIFGFFKEKNLFLLLPGTVLIIFAISYSVGVWLEEIIQLGYALIYALGGGSIVSGLVFLALLPQIKKANPHAVAQSIVIGGIFIVLGGIMLLSVQYEISVRAIYLVLSTLGILTGAWFLIDRSQTWLGMASYLMFFTVGIIYISVGDGHQNANPVQYQYSQYVAPFIFGSLGVPFLLAYFRNSSRKWALITGYICCVFAGFLLLAFSSLLDGNLIGPYILFAIGSPFITAFIRNKIHWALIPGYVSLSLGLALLLGSIIREATSLEVAFYYTTAGFLVLSGLGMQVMRPKFNEHLVTD